VTIRFQADNDLSGLIAAATLRREPAIDFQTALAAGLDRLDDLPVLHRTAAEGGILVTHDKRSMPRHFAEFLREGRRSPGVLVVIPQDAPLAGVVETLVLIWADGQPEDWVNVITKIPF
jgi:hypothetical protein